ncbi:MAG TPA: ATP-binding cassette domain-containing protein [Candidatus Dormibacteraeota bacterium]|nr:ATP-binding cassette domain-containing protein [Candidatus Dormibacteraeota bacterium]
MSARPPAAIVARGVGFRYAGRPRPALADVDVSVEPGECLLVVGPSGSGKSTLALALAGLVPREFAGDWTGELLVDGLDTRSTPPPELAARVGLVFQDPASQLVMERVEDDVAFGLEDRGWTREAMRARVPEATGAVGLGGLERRRTTTLSGGQQQRVALAGVLAPWPSILVLDEPTANLDPEGAAAFIERLAAMRAERRVAIVLVEHRVDLAWPLAHRVLALGSDGRPIDHGTPDDVVRRSGRRLVEEGVWLPEAIEARLAPSPRDGFVMAAGARCPAGPRAPILEAEQVRFGYDRRLPVLERVDLVVGRGERVALMGSNGSGKSTLARILVGLVRPDAGRVRLLGDDPSRLPAAELARRAGLVFQDPERQFLGRAVGEEVSLGLRPEERDRVEPLMASLGLPLDAFGDRSPYTLSGGEQRRLSIACALVRRPSLLVLDEPTFGQDRHGVEALLAILAQRVEEGSGVVAATHDVRFARAFACRTVRLEGGRAIEYTASERSLLAAGVVT